MPISHSEKEIFEILKSASNSTAAEKLKLQKYIGTQLEVFNIPTPVQRKIFLTGFSFTHEQMPQNELATWNQIWAESNSFEIKNMACFFIESHLKRDSFLEFWPVVKAWAENIDNWAHSDGLSKFYSHCLEADSSNVLPTFKKWNKSLNPWLRRQSIVSLLYYASGRKKILDFNTMIQLVEPLLADEHFYVQRAVGWTLREMGNVYRTKTNEFLKKNAILLSSVAFSAATEKIDAVFKESLKLKRKNNRSKK